MESQNSAFNFKKKKLVVAMGVAMIGGMMTGCGSGSGGGGGETAAAAATPGIYTIKAVGGSSYSSVPTAAGGYGGSGGSISIENRTGTGGVEVRANGAADASFSSIIPAQVADTGANPLLVTADMTVVAAELWTSPVADGATITAGTLYIGTDGVLRTSSLSSALITNYATDVVMDDNRFYSDGNELYIAVGDDALADLAAAGSPYTHKGSDYSSIYAADGDAAVVDAVYTGISVDSGTVLTLDVMDGSSVRITVADDIDNSGTITTSDRTSNPAYRGALNMQSYRYIASGAIDTSGNATAIYGGSVAIFAAYGHFNSGAINTSGMASDTGIGGGAGSINLQTYGYIKNSGVLSATGGSSTVSTGGVGAGVTLEAAYVENSGNISSASGNSPTGFNASSGGSVYLDGDFGSNNSGDIDSSGGDAGNVAGRGGSVYIQANINGSVRNSGAVDARGGDSLNNSAAGDGGDIQMYAYGAELINSGDLTTAAGSRNGSAVTRDYIYAGSINLYTSDSDSGIPAGDLVISGNLDSRGSTNTAANGSYLGSYPGQAGGIQISIDGGERGDSSVGEQRVSLLGYTSIDNSAGDGGYRTNSAGSIYMTSGSQYDTVAGGYETGPVINEADIISHGGNAVVEPGLTTISYGSSGGYVRLRTSINTPQVGSNATVTNSGNIDTSGGESYNVTSNSYGYARGVRLQGYHGVDNSGNLTANGGDDTATDGGTAGYGGYANAPDLNSDDGTVVNSGTISVNGGYGEYRGGYSNGVDMIGTTVVNIGDISVNGGSADVALANSVGAYAGTIYLTGTSAMDAASNSGALSYSGGVGATNGADGGAIIGITCEGNCW